MKVRFLLLLASLFLGLTLGARADSRADEWIAKARAALGSEKALNAVESVRFTGTLETTEPVKTEDGTTATRPVRLAIDIVFQKPYQQLVTLRSDKYTDTTGLDDYDGWRRRAEVGSEKQWQLTLLDPGQIKHLRANTWENLAFYRGIETRGGRVEFQGEDTIDGHPCVKLAFIHADDIVFTRYFDKSTGRLVKTITETGGEIREEGERIVAGVRYPAKLINKDPSGQVATITFDTIKVNEPVPASEFVVPTLMAR